MRWKRFYYPCGSILFQCEVMQHFLLRQAFCLRKSVREFTERIVMSFLSAIRLGLPRSLREEHQLDSMVLRQVVSSSELQRFIFDLRGNVS